MHELWTELVYNSRQSKQLDYCVEYGGTVHFSGRKIYNLCHPRTPGATCTSRVRWVRLSLKLRSTKLYLRNAKFLQKRLFSPSGTRYVVPRALGWGPEFTKSGSKDAQGEVSPLFFLRVLDDFWAKFKILKILKISTFFQPGVGFTVKNFDFQISTAVGRILDFREIIAFYFENVVRLYFQNFKFCPGEPLLPPHTHVKGAFTTPLLRKGHLGLPL